MMNKPLIIALMIFLSPVVVEAVERIVILALFKDMAVLEVDGKSHTLSSGDTTVDGITLVSASSEEAVLKINGETDTYSLGAHIGTGFSLPVAGQLVNIAPDSQGMFWVNGSINKFQARFVVDTGATFITMNRHAANRFGIDYKTSGEPAISTTASGEETVYIVNLRYVSVGDIRLENVTAAIHDSDFPRAILLGNSFLNQVSLKREGRLLQLSR